MPQLDDLSSPHGPGAKQYTHRCDRNEPIELAHCRTPPQDRATPSEEAGAGRGSAAAVAR